MKNSLGLLFFIVTALGAPPADSTTILADALIDFHVEAYAPLTYAPYPDDALPWHNTGLWLEPGDVFALHAEGEVWVAPPFTPERAEGPQGRGSPCEGCLVELPNGAAALVGKIGVAPGAEFLVGAEFQGIASGAGFLFLAFNDDHYSDNSGYFLVSTAAVPEPSLTLLLTGGLVLLGVRAAARTPPNR